MTTARERAVEIARFETDVEQAAGDLLEEFHDAAALRDALDELEQGAPEAGDSVLERARAILRTALEVGYSGE